MASTRKGPIKGMVKKLPTVGEATIDQAVKDARKPIMAALRADAGSDRKLSGLRNGKAMMVTVRKQRAGNVVEAEIKGGPQTQRAPWFWLNDGTKAGMRSRPASRRRSGRIISYRHPGTAAKRTWDRAVEPLVPQVQKDFRDNVRKAIS